MLHFNSTKVQFRDFVQRSYQAAYEISIPLRYNLEPTTDTDFPAVLANFNSTKVQFGDSQIESIDLQNFISIPLRYNLEEPIHNRSRQRL